jgi:3-phytase
MVVSIVGTPSHADYATNVTTFSTGALSVQADDIIEFHVITTLNTGTTLTPNLSTGSLLASALGTSDMIQSQAWYYRVPSTGSVTINVTSAAARQGSIVWRVLRGVKTTATPIVASFSNPSPASSVAIPSITTTAADTYIASGLHMGSGSDAPTYSAGLTEIVNATRRNGILLTRGNQASPGASPAGTATFGAGSYNGRAFTIGYEAAASGPPPLVVQAEVETDVFPAGTGDIADGAAIVPDRANPANSVVIGTNKITGGGGGLFVYDLQGNILSSVTPGAANSVDTRDLTGVSGWGDVLLVMTTDREANLLRYYTMNRTTKALTAVGTSSLGYEPYGSCLYVHSTGVVYAFVSDRGPDDTSARNWYQYPLSWSGSAASAGAAARTVSVANVVEGMAADDVAGKFYLSQEDVGLYQYDASPSGGSTRVAVDTVGAGNLVADVEDVALAYGPQGTKILVSSQGDSSYHVYDATTFVHETRFTATRPGGGAIGDTDGLDVYLGFLGPDFPNGLIVVHNGLLTPTSNYNFLDPIQVFDAAYWGDPIGITDSLSVVRTVGIATAEPVGITDSATRVLSAVRSQGDPIGITDSAVVTLSRARTQDDGVGITDSVTTSFSTSVAAADPVGITDATVLERALAAAEPVGIVDSVTRALSADRPDDDPTGITDVVTTQLTAVRTQGDPVGIVDSLIVELYGEGSANLADPVGITDEVSLTRTSGHQASDPVGVTDEITVVMLRVRTIADFIDLTDAVSSTTGGGVEEASPVGIQDSVLVEVQATRGPAELVGITDSIAIERSGGLALLEHVGITDAVTVTWDGYVPVPLPDVLTITLVPLEMNTITIVEE